MSIKPIAQSSIHHICTGQIIDGIAMAVKELIENSIDAGATMIGNYLKLIGNFYNKNYFNNSWIILTIA